MGPRPQSKPNAMDSHDKRVDAYIEKAGSFAKPILTRLRELVHKTCPAAQETIKWGHPSFEYKGMLCGMAAFKQHCAFGFWKHELVMGKDAKAREAMGSFGCLTKLSDLPTTAKFTGLMKKAIALNDAGVKAPRAKTVPKQKVAMHPQLKAALAKNKRALATFEGFPLGQQREYLEWVGEAKQEATRTRRIVQAVQWLAEGKRRNWKYEAC